ncbi:MAG: carboxylating nicotinate-nucleotide diphosphorylase [Alphaproteobacteria bacterium]|nr:carboxylating nicotinate-nucleotide diphosphorylase [Alphaproteobacteria bacterium]
MPWESSLEDHVRATLAEDLGESGDVTSTLVIPPDARARVALVSRAEGVLAGMDAVRCAFNLQGGKDIQMDSFLSDGDKMLPGTVLARIEGLARRLLETERTALNFLTHMSGIATLTHQYVQMVSHTKARIRDTRKTLPSLRMLQKQAVRAGGGINHRFGLGDAILIKDNHIAMAGGIEPVLRALGNRRNKALPVEIEVDTLEQLSSLLDHLPGQGSDIAVLLDNMDVSTLREAVRLVDGRILTEASGGININTVQAVAETGVDFIAVGALTHSAPALDIGLDFE